MAQTVRVEENCDSEPVSIPLVLGSGEHILRRIRLEAESVQGAWYELYLVGTPGGFLIEKHSGSARSLSRQKETWFRRSLPDAERKYCQILSSKLNQQRRSPRRYKVVGI